MPSPAVVYILAKQQEGPVIMAIDYSDYEFLKVEVTERVAMITINRPDSLNAVHNALHHELEQIWIDVRADQDVNAIILTGAGRAFCAGGDVKGMATGGLVGPTDKKGKGRGRGPIAAANGRRLVENMLDVEQPIIGAINGDAAVSIPAARAIAGVRTNSSTATTPHVKKRRAPAFRRPRLVMSSSLSGAKNRWIAMCNCFNGIFMAGAADR